MALLFCALGLSACNIELYANLDQKQANEIVATLFKQGIPAERVIGKGGQYAVNVDETRLAEAVAVLNDNGLPKQKFQTLCDVFKGEGGLIASPVQERAQMICGLSQDLARTISDIDGVLSARVHLVLPENDPLRQQLIPSSASVFIRHASTAPLNNLVPQVKMLVANGVAGLSYDKVSVVLVPVEAPDASSAHRSDQELASFLGLWMHRDSVKRAAWMFFGLLGALTATGGGAAFLIWNQRRRIYLLPTAGRKRELRGDQKKDRDVA
jgi:type III secretion protein J